MSIAAGTIPRDAVRQAVVAGGAAGNFTVTGIKPRDQLVSVVAFQVGAAVGVDGVEDLTSEFAVTAADTINNAAGTATTNGFVVVTWLSVA